MKVESLLKYRKLFYPGLVSLVWLIPFLLMHFEWKGVSGTLPRYWQTYEWTGYFGAAILAVLFMLEYLRVKPQNLIERMAWAAPFLCLLPILYQYAEYPVRSWDYDCYQIAGEKIIAGESPYFGFYFYPPLLAWCMAQLQLLLGSAEKVFFTYQYIQLLLTGLLAFQIQALLKRIQPDKLMGALLLLGIMIFNIPLWRTIHHNQVNLILVNTLLFTILYWDKYPIANGILLAIGTHLKLYPLIISGIWLIRKQFKSVLIFFLSLAFVAIGLNWTLPGIWKEFFSFFVGFPGGAAMRDNGLHSILYNVFHVTGLNQGLDAGAFNPFIKSIYYLLASLICLFFLYRFFARAVQRKNSYASESTASIFWLKTGDIADAGAFMVLFSPMVWEHHYVLTIPIALFAICLNPKPLNWLALFLIFGMPVADIFLLSLTRISGLFILLHSLSAPEPEILRPWLFRLKKAAPTLAFTVFSVFFLSFVSRFETRILGDGHEYVLQTQAIASHGTPEIFPEDTEALLTHPYPVDRQDHFKGLKEFQQRGSVPMPPGGWNGLYYTPDSQLFGYHFSFYSYLAVPVRWILKLLKDDWLKSFALLNTLLLLLPLGYIVFFSSLPIKNRIALFLLFFFSPVLWYLRWPHTEVLTASLIALSLLFYTDKRFLPAMLIAAFASLQNQPVALLILLPLWGYWNQERKISLPLLSVTGLTTAIVLLPSLFYYLQFGTSNLIVKIGSASFSYINLTRLWDFFFDINQGIVAGYPTIIILFSIYCLIWIVRKQISTVLIYLIILMGIATSASMTINWNMGQAGISRYAVWAGMILLIPVCAEAIKNKIVFYSAMGITLFIQLFILNSFGMLNVDDGSCISHNAAARWVLGTNPSLYNPEMETFQERSLGREGVLKEEILKGPIFFFRSDGKATKAIVAHNRLDTCDFFATKNHLIQEKFKTLEFNPQGFAYIDLIEADCYPKGRFENN
jgi:hypothetical protein